MFSIQVSLLWLKDMSAKKKTLQVLEQRALKFNSVTSVTLPIKTQFRSRHTPWAASSREACKDLNTYHVNSLINDNIVHLAHLNEGGAFFARGVG